MDKFVHYLHSWKIKIFSASGESPVTPWPGNQPLDPGAMSPDSHYRLRPMLSICAPTFISKFTPMIISIIPQYGYTINKWKNFFQTVSCVQIAKNYSATTPSSKRNPWRCSRGMRLLSRAQTTDVSGWSLTVVCCLRSPSPLLCCLYYPCLHLLKQLRPPHLLVQPQH